MRVCVVTNGPASYSETFIRQHAVGLPAETTLVDVWPPWRVAGARRARALPGRAFDRALHTLSPKAYRRRVTGAYVKLFRGRADAVLAEYGPTGVAVMDACGSLGLPLFVHFHGFDASVRSLLEEYAADYAEMFRRAAGIIAVSHAMRERLIEMGAPPGRVHYNPCGVDCAQFDGASPADAPPQVLAVGRFVEKKGPRLTLEAFAEVLRQCPEARLRMIGDGPLLEDCRRLSRTLSLGHTVTFPGRRPQPSVAEEMRRARLFAQHSIEAASGDSEGTPVSVLEACASGLPVVATRHGGIPDVVTDEETGLLVEEGDAHAMARQMLRLLRDPAHAARLGAAARRRIVQEFSAERSLARLWSIIKGGADS